MLIYSEAIVQQWEVNHLKAKFGSDEANWLTEGQWAHQRSVIEQERDRLQGEIDIAEQHLEDAKNVELVSSSDWQAENDNKWRVAA